MIKLFALLHYTHRLNLGTYLLSSVGFPECVLVLTNSRCKVDR